jgi:hypothetical protein
MNERDYIDHQRYIVHLLQRGAEDTATRIMGTIFLDWAAIPKRYLYPALAKLLGMECECRTIECKGCEDVEEWLDALCPHEEGEDDD